MAGEALAAMDELGDQLPNYQVVFFTNDSSLPTLPDNVLNVPRSSDINEFSALINHILEGEKDKYQPILLDFLVDSKLLRPNIGEFASINLISGESVIRVECIRREPAPEPSASMIEQEWVADVKIFEDRIYSVNYGGELNVWSLSGENLTRRSCSDTALKCLDTFGVGSLRYLIMGCQNQTLVLYKVGDSTTKTSGSVTLDEMAVFRGHTRSVECVAVNSDAQRFLSGGFDGYLKVWNPLLLDDVADESKSKSNIDESNAKIEKRAKYDAKTKTPLVTLESHTQAVTGVNWNPLNESQAVTVSWDHRILVWDLEMAGTILTIPSTKAFTSLSINKTSGLMITGSADPTIRLWDIRAKETNTAKATFLGHTGWVSDVKWSPHDDHLFTTASFDNTVKMWDLRSPKAALYDMMGHEDRPLAVDWARTASNTGLIASGAADGTIRTFKTR